MYKKKVPQTTALKKKGQQPAKWRSTRNAAEYYFDDGTRVQVTEIRHPRRGSGIHVALCRPVNSLNVRQGRVVPSVKALRKNRHIINVVQMRQKTATALYYALKQVMEQTGLI